MKPPRTLICGSLAFDTIMVFPDRFARHILPDQTHVLSVAFQISQMRREWGGCAGNIAYSLKQLGGEPVLMATLGEDGGAYADRMAELGIAADGVRRVDDTYTAQAFIITDLDDNQITAFHPGAMNQSHVNQVDEVADIGLGIVAPDGRDGMRSHAEQFLRRRVPFVFDPGQGLPMFSGGELLEMIDAATYVAVNDYEAGMLCERTGLGLDALAHRVEAMIVTRGASGSQIFTEGRVLNIPVVPATTVVDPTGCGDAYRAGLLYGIGCGWDWGKTGRLAALLGSIKIECRGGQNHRFTRDDIARRFREQFGHHPW